MSGPKKKDKQSMIDEQSEISNTDAMHQFAEVISQNISEKDLSHADSFEYYAHQLRSHLHSDLNTFKFRFSEGYRVLIEELEKSAS